MVVSTGGARCVVTPSPSVLDEYLAIKGAGQSRLKVPLKGSLRLRDGGEAPAHLVLTDRGLYVAGVLGAGAGELLDALAAELRYDEGVLGDTLRVGSFSFAVPPGKGDDARRAIALARVAPPGSGRYPGPLASRHIEPITEVEARWLKGRLDEHEPVLAWLETASDVDVPSRVLARRCPRRFLLTDRRALLVALSPVGDVLETPLEGSGLEVKRAVGRDTVRVGDVEWSAPLLLESLYQELSPALALDGDDRIREVARLNWRQRGKKKEPLEAARRLLLLLVARGDPLAVVVAGSLQQALCVDDAALAAVGLDAAALDGAARDAALRTLVETSAGSGALAKAWSGFALSVDVGMAWLASLLAGDDAARRFAVELHGVLREALLEASGEGFAKAAVDIAYAEHLLQIGREEEAQIVLESRLAALPNEELLDLLPSKGEDLTEGAGGQRFRIRILELLVRARGAPGVEDAATVAELARLSPLVPARVQALVDVGEGHAREAARQVLAVLEPGGLAPLDDSADDSPDDEVHPLGKKLLFERLQHPAAREGHPLGRLQGFLGSVKAPDHSALQAYCERLSRDGVAQRALSDASVAFGVPGIAGYVSRGDKAIGVRAYEGSTPFLLVGGRHLEPGSDFAMHPWELRFAVAAEVAHLRFRHTRVTKSEVWAGAFEKGRFGFDVLLGVLPALKGVEVIDKVWEIIEKYKKGPLGRVMRGVDVAEKTVNKVRGKRARPEGRPREQLVAAPNEKLVAAHRVMQLTADRAGLLLAGDLGAAVRSMFLASHSYRAELPVTERHGLVTTLSRRDDEGQIVFQDLAVRIGALIAFYLSDDYPRLKERLTTG